MKSIQLQLCLLAALFSVRGALAQESSLAAERWSFRFDIGGNMPADADLTEFNGPITQGGEMKLSAGGQFGVAAGYHLTPWLSLEGELGVAYNNVDSIGDWSYPDTGLSHLLLMVNVVVQKQIGQFVPFAGAGVGGDFSYLSFGNSYGYYYSGWEPDGEGRDTAFAYQAFAGLSYHFSDNCSVGVMYRYFATQEQSWDVDWWNGADFDVGVDAIHVHAVSLALIVRF